MTIDPLRNPLDEKAAVERVVRDSICWALTKDRALQESTMAHDEDLFLRPRHRVSLNRCRNVSKRGSERSGSN